MKAEQVYELMTNPTVPALVRDKLQTALSLLRVKHEGHVEVNRFELDMIARSLKVKPHKCSGYTFIRIYDETCNGVDIQTRTYNSIFEPLIKTFGK